MARSKPRDFLRRIVGKMEDGDRVVVLVAPPSMRARDEASFVVTKTDGRFVVVAEAWSEAELSMTKAADVERVVSNEGQLVLVRLAFVAKGSHDVHYLYDVAWLGAAARYPVEEAAKEVIRARAREALRTRRRAKAAFLRAFRTGADRTRGEGRRAR